jgi:hypothetical protein
MRFFSLLVDKEILGDLVKERQNVVFIKWYKKNSIPGESDQWPEQGFEVISGV